MNALSSTLAAFQLKLGLRAVVPTGIDKMDLRAYLTACARAESAESAIEIGRRLQRRQITGLRNMGLCSILTAFCTLHFSRLFPTSTRSGILSLNVTDPSPLVDLVARRLALFF